MFMHTLAEDGMHSPALRETQSLRLNPLSLAFKTFQNNNAGHEAYAKIFIPNTRMRTSNLLNAKFMVLH